MNNKIFSLLIIMIIIVSNISLALAQPQPPSPPQSDSDAPLKERLETFYDDKESYIEQKRLCKEEVIITQAPSGTCWTRLKPMMINLLLKQINLTHMRLLQLKDNNITFSNIDEINSKLNDSRIIFENTDSSKFLIKSKAKELEDLINDIENKASLNQTSKLIEQMDKLVIKAEEIRIQLEAKLVELRNTGVDVSSLEASLNDYKIELERTKNSVDEAKTKYSEMSSSSEVSALASQVRTFIDNAQNYLVKAFDKAKAMSLTMSESEGQVSNTSGGQD